MILIFGKSGQVATELQAFKGVRALGRDQVDLCDPQACASAILLSKPRAVINVAAYTNVDKAESQNELACLINGKAPGAMAMACAELNIPLVHISTDYVFDGSGNMPWSITDAPNSKNAYGRSKLLGERSIIGSGCVHAILRTSWVVSAHGSNFVKTMVELSKTRDSIAVVNDQTGGPTCARDIALACISIAKQLMREPNKTGIYHYCGQPDVSWSEFAETIFKELGRQTIVQPIPTSKYQTRALRPINSRLDCKVTERVFGISRPFWLVGLKQILKELESGYD